MIDDLCLWISLIVSANCSTDHMTLITFELNPQGSQSNVCWTPFCSSFHFSKDETLFSSVSSFLLLLHQICNMLEFEMCWRRYMICYEYSQLSCPLTHADFKIMSAQKPVVFYSAIIFVDKILLGFCLGLIIPFLFLKIRNYLSTH